MMKGQNILAATLSTLCLVVTPVHAAPPDAARLMQQMKAVFEPSQPTIRRVVITTGTAADNAEWIAAQAVKQLPDGTAMLTVILAPESLVGSAFLVRERPGQASAMWVYAPAARRVREIVPVDAYEHFLGTDFTYADLGLVRLHEHYRFLGEADHDGQRAYKVEEVVPEERAYYSRIITWIGVDSKLPLQREYYDVAGELWKAEEFTEVTPINGVPTPLRITMQDVQVQNTTELHFAQVHAGTEVSDSLFDPEQLSQVAEASLWQEYRSPASAAE